MTKRDIGEALDSLAEDVRQQMLALTRQYREMTWPPMVEQMYKIALIKQAVDTPRRAKSQIQNWITQYNSRNGAGTAQTFLQECLTAFGSSKTLASINAEITIGETFAQGLVNNVNNSGWTFDQVAAAIEARVSPPLPEEAFTYQRLPIPAGYVTVWGEPW